MLTVKSTYFRAAKVTALCLMVGFAVTAALISCNVTRVVTTRCEYHQHGDTCTTIQIKTIETYDARKNADGQ